MKPHESETVQSIFQLHSSIEYFFFKEFIHSYPLPKGLNPTHIKTMLALRFIGGKPMSEISKLLSLEKGSFTPVANKLIKDGYVEKLQSVEDRRVYNLSLTKKGTDLAQDFGAKHISHIETILSPLGEEEKESFLKSIEEITATLKRVTGKDLPAFPHGPKCP